MILFQDVSFAYDQGGKVLDSANLGLEPGLTLLLGPNGCGKSTLLKLAAGVERPDAGRISIAGRDIWREEVEARRGLVYLPEQPDLTPYATIGEILDLVCRLRGEAPAAKEKVLTFFGLQDLAGRTVRELSMGQRRRAVFAACLVGSASYLLLDEPLEGMDLNIQREILAWIEGRARNGATVVVVSHTLAPFLRFATRAVTVKEGQTVYLRELPADQDERQALLEDLAKGRP